MCIHDMYMKFLILRTTDPHLNLAIEEYLFETADDDVIMLWQNEPSVIIGRNQNVYAEINSDYLKEKGIKLARRITGGGAVYHDLGNLNYTFISAKKTSGIDFKTFTAPIIDALSSMGINVVLNGRNDLEIDDKKISGNAQHSSAERLLHHGTLLFDTDLNVLSNALKVDEEKIKAKAIKSTRSRVANLKEYVTDCRDTNEFVEILSEYFIERFSPTIIEAPKDDRVFELCQRNRSEEWLYPKSKYLSEYTVSRKKRFNFGTVELKMVMSGDVVDSIVVEGDFFGTRDVSDLDILLRGKNICEVEKIIRNMDISEYIFCMNSQQFIDLIQ